MTQPASPDLRTVLTALSDALKSLEVPERLAEFDRFVSDSLGQA